ncbi:MAG: hypothetical protein K1X74_17700 [Pirellulales bacterium]|nr:hypothetical protein [Pirellulales bacterium]
MARLRSLRDNLSPAREVLAAHAPWSPLDYVPGISRRGDRALYAEQLTAELPADDDLRFVAPLDDLGSLAVCAERLPWDSEFFGLGVARLNAVLPLEAPWHRPLADYRPVLEQFLAEVAARGIRYVFATVEPRDLATIRALGELGFALIETRYYHHGQIQPPPLVERLPVRKAVENDIPHLARAAAQTVNIYDRFHADPALDAAKVAQLMAIWVEKSVRGEMADVVIVPDVPEPGALVTYRYHREKWGRWGLNLVQGVLSAVSPEFAGWMGKLGPEVNLHLLGVGAQHSYGSTQVTNRAILWFAEESGAKFGRCEYIFRRLL